MLTICSVVKGPLFISFNLLNIEDSLSGLYIAASTFASPACMANFALSLIKERISSSIESISSLIDFNFLSTAIKTLSFFVRKFSHKFY